MGWEADSLNEEINQHLSYLQGISFTVYHKNVSMQSNMNFCIGYIQPVCVCMCV